MSYSKTTIIVADTVEGGNPLDARKLGRPLTFAESQKSLLWSRDNSASFALRGHWSVEAVQKFIAKRNLHNASVTHHENDLSGHGRNCRRQIISEGIVVV